MPRSSIKLDIVTAYVASATKVGAWAAVSALVFKNHGVEGLGFLALVRSTVGIFNYTTLGLGPAMVHLLAKARTSPTVVSKFESASGSLLDYESPPPISPPKSEFLELFANGLVLAFILMIVGLYLASCYGAWFTKIHTVPTSPDAFHIRKFVIIIGAGAILRLVSDAFGARLQVQGAIALDNILTVAADLGFAIFAWLWAKPDIEFFSHIGGAYAFTGAALVYLRGFFALACKPQVRRSDVRIDPAILMRILKFGSLVSVANLADFLYAPTDFILINNLIDPATAGVYSPAVQIDAALLLLVAGLASVIFPRAAVAHAGGDVKKLREYYVRGTVASSVILLVAGGLVWGASPVIFRVWLHNPMTATQAILPLVLVHTVVGGSSGIGRSILLAMGKVKVFTSAVLIAGVVNVILSFVFVKYLHLGLRGIILGTIVAVIGRCAVWMPWYVMKMLEEGTEARSEGNSG